jgi:hypothetical protein
VPEAEITTLNCFAGVHVVHRHCQRLSITPTASAGRGNADVHSMSQRFSAVGGDQRAGALEAHCAAAPSCVT